MAGRGVALPQDSQQQSDMTNTEEMSDFDRMLMDTTPEEIQSLLGETNMMTDTNTDMESMSNMPADQLFTQSNAAQQQQPVANMPPMGASMPTSLPPLMIPDRSMGPSYSPVIGWYYPAMPMTPTSGMGTPDISEGFTPMSATQPPSTPANKLQAPPNPFGPAKPKSKRKYGPSAYLEQQARNRADGLLRARNASVADADYISKAKQRSDRENKTSVSAFRHKNKGPEIVKVCVCNDKEAHKVKRPKNAFILYRSANSKNILRKLGTNANQDVSKLAGENWHNESKEVRDHFYALAEQEKQRHKAMNPGYVYQPGRSNMNKFGSQSCTCGAFRANMQALLEQKTKPVGDGEEEEEELEEYVPPGGHYRASRPIAAAAPVANMMPTSIPDLRTLGLSARQQAEAQVYADSLKRKRQASAGFGQIDAGQPSPKRRSPRLNSHAVSYAEPDENDIYDTSTPPAHNTRSSSKPRTPPGPSPRQVQFNEAFGNGNDNGFDFNFNPMSSVEFDDLFGDGEGGDFGFDPSLTDMGDNIVVADRRPSSSRSRSRRRSSGGIATSPHNTRYGLRRRS